MHINTQHNYHKTVYIETPKIFYYDTHKIIKSIYIYMFIYIYMYIYLYVYIFLVYIKMDQENITFSKNQGTSQAMTDLHILGYNTSFGYEDFYNCYDTDDDKILLPKKSDNEYFIRYNDVNKRKIVHYN